MAEDPMIIAVRLREALLRLQPTLYERLDEDTWRVRYRNPIEEGHPWKIVYDALDETPESVEKAAARNEALESVAYAAQALEDAWLGFFKESNTATMKIILQVEEALCDSLVDLRLINGDAVRDWEAVRGKAGKDLQIEGIDIKPGRMDVRFAPGQETLEVFAGEMWKFLKDKGGENYVEAHLHTPEGQDLIVHIQKKTGKSPNELQREAEARVKELEAGAVAMNKGIERLRRERDEALQKLQEAT